MNSAPRPRAAAPPMPGSGRMHGRRNKPFRAPAKAGALRGESGRPRSGQRSGLRRSTSLHVAPPAQAPHPDANAKSGSLSMEVWHGTTIIGVRKNGKAVIAGDGQVSLQSTVIKPNAKKVRRIGQGGKVIGGFAGATADAFTLFERLEKKLEQHKGQLMRAAVELAKDWRTDKYLRNLEAMMIVADKDVTLILTGNGDVLEPASGVAAIGSPRG